MVFLCWQPRYRHGLPLLRRPLSPRASRSLRQRCWATQCCEEPSSSRLRFFSFLSGTFLAACHSAPVVFSGSQSKFPCRVANYQHVVREQAAQLVGQSPRRLASDDVVEVVRTCRVVVLQDPPLWNFQVVATATRGTQPHTRKSYHQPTRHPAIAMTWFSSGNQRRQFVPYTSTASQQPPFPAPCLGSV